MLRHISRGVRVYRRSVHRPFPFGLWAAGLALACGSGMLLGLPSAFVPDAGEPLVGAALLVGAARLAVLSRRRTRS